MGARYLPAHRIPDVETMRDNLLAAYDAADSAMREDGTLWYPRAYQSCQTIAGLLDYRVTVDQVAAITAITSPGKGWRVNIALPARVIKHILDDPHGAVEMPEWFPGYRPAWNRCRDVLLYGELSAARGRKVGPFFRALCGDESATVIDRHMVRICAGVSGYETCSDKPFERMIEALKQAAEMRSVEPRTFQAIVWIAYRRVTLGRGGRTIEAIYDGNPDAGEEQPLFV